VKATGPILWRWFQSLLALAGAIVLAVMFYRTWQRPLAVEHGAWVRIGFAVLGIDALVNLAGLTLNQLADPETPIRLNGVLLRGARQQTIRRRVMIGCFGIFALLGVGVAVAAGSSTLLWGFLLMMTARGVGIFFDSAEVRQQETSRFGGKLVLLLVVVLLTAFVPFPQCGLTPDVVAQIFPNRGSGIWAEHPERVMALGLIYFGLVGLTEAIMACRPRCRPDSSRIGVNYN
jgi:hypothetical protein